MRFKSITKSMTGPWSVSSGLPRRTARPFVTMTMCSGCCDPCRTMHGLRSAYSIGKVRAMKRHSNSQGWTPCARRSSRHANRRLPAMEHPQPRTRSGASLGAIIRIAARTGKTAIIEARRPGQGQPSRESRIRRAAPQRLVRDQGEGARRVIARSHRFMIANDVAAAVRSRCSRRAFAKLRILDSSSLQFRGELALSRPGINP